MKRVLIRHVKAVLGAVGVRTLAAGALALLGFAPTAYAGAPLSDSAGAAASYTVEFHNGDLEYVIEGGSGTSLSTVFEKLSYPYNVADVADVGFSNPELIAVEPTEDGDWLLTSLQPFDTDETLAVTFKDGGALDIAVTDWMDNGGAAFDSGRFYTSNQTGSNKLGINNETWPVFLFPGVTLNNSFLTLNGGGSNGWAIKYGVWYDGYATISGSNNSGGRMSWSRGNRLLLSDYYGSFSVSANNNAQEGDYITITVDGYRSSNHNDQFKRTFVFITGSRRTVNFNDNNGGTYTSLSWYYGAYGNEKFVGVERVNGYDYFDQDGRITRTLPAATSTKTGYHLLWYFDQALTRYAGVAGDPVTITPDWQSGTIYGKWVPNNYTVQFNGNGSTSGSTASQGFTYDVAQNLRANGFVRQWAVNYNYNGGSGTPASTTSSAPFLGWATSASGNASYSDQQSVRNLTAARDGTVTLYAKWSAMAAVTLPTPTRAGYTFSGWYTAASGGTRVGGAGGSYTPASNGVTLYAQWTRDTYTITYNSNGGSAVASQTYNVDTSVQLAGAPTRKGYAFAGWKLASAVNTWAAATYGAGQSVGTGKYGNITLEAQWTAKTDVSYTVHYYRKGTTVPIAGDKIVDGQTFGSTVTESAPEVANYTAVAPTSLDLTLDDYGKDIKFYYTADYVLIQRDGTELKIPGSIDITDLIPDGVDPGNIPAVNAILNAPDDPDDPDSGRFWEHLVTGTEPGTPLLTDVDQPGADTDPTVGVGPDPKPEYYYPLGYNVWYELRRNVLDENGWTSGGETTASDVALVVPTLAAGLDADVPGAYFRVVAHVSPNEATKAANNITEDIDNVIPTKNIAGVIRVASATANTVTAVPFGDLPSDPTEEESAYTTVAHYIAAGGLAAGDSIRAFVGVDEYGNDWYLAWYMGADGEFEKPGTATMPDGTTIPVPSAEEKRLDRGAAWVSKGTAGVYYIAGQYVNKTPLTVTIAGGSAEASGCTMVGNQSIKPITVNEIDWGDKPSKDDFLTIPVAGGQQVNLTWNGRNWGRSVRSGRSTIRVTDYTIPAGQGFWYYRNDGDPFEIKLPADDVADEYGASEEPSEP